MIASTRIHLRAVYFSQRHGGGAGEDGVSWIELADGGRILAADRAVVAEVQAVTTRRPAAGRSAAGDGRHLLCSAHGLSVESVAAGVRQRQHRASLLPGVDERGRVRQGVARDATALRPSARHRLELAKCRRVDDQGAAGRGKKPAKTRPIAVSWGSSGRFFPTAAACRLAWRSVAPILTTRNFSSRRSTASLSLVRGARAAGNICASTKGTTPKRSAG